MLLAIDGQVLVSQSVEVDDQEGQELEAHMEEQYWNGALEEGGWQRDAQMQSQSPPPPPLENYPGPSSSYQSSSTPSDASITLSNGRVASFTPSPKQRHSKALPEDPELANISYYIHAHGLSRYEIDTLSYASGRWYREIVYKCSNFDASNFYGPFLKRENEDQPLEVDWKVIYSIVIVMALNVKSAWHQVGTLASTSIGIALIYLP